MRHGIETRKQNGCVNKPARGMATMKASRSVPGPVAACIQPGHTSSITRNTLFVVLYGPAGYSIAGYVQLARGRRARPTALLRSGPQRDSCSLQLQCCTSLHCHFEFDSKNMASRSPRHTFDVYFKDTMEKDAFMVRLKSIRERLTPRGQTQLSYHDLMLVVEGQATPPTTAADTTSMLRSNGKRKFSYLHASFATKQLL